MSSLVPISLPFTITLIACESRNVYHKFNFFKFEKPSIQSDRDATNPSKDPLNGIGGPMNKSKSKRMNQALQGLIIKRLHQIGSLSYNWIKML